jgi:hypothetical protein
VHVIQDPARLGWQPVVQVEHYHVEAHEILRSETWLADRSYQA